MQLQLESFRDRLVAHGMLYVTVEENLVKRVDFNLAEAARGQHTLSDDYFDQRVGASYFGHDLKAGKDSFKLTFRINKSI